MVEFYDLASKGTRRQARVQAVRKQNGRYYHFVYILLVDLNEVLEVRLLFNELW